MEISEQAFKNIVDNIGRLKASNEKIKVEAIDTLISSEYLRTDLISPIRVMQALFIREYPTTYRYTDGGEPVKENHHRRSLEDMFLMVRSYNNYTFTSVAYASRHFSSNFCFDVNRRVYREPGYYRGHQEYSSSILSSLTLSEKQLQNPLDRDSLKEGLFRDYSSFLETIRKAELKL